MLPKLLCTRIPGTAGLAYGVALTRDDPTGGRESIDVGRIRFHPESQGWVFEPYAGRLLSPGHLRDIADFITNLAVRRASRERVLLDGTKVPERPESVEMTITSLCTAKWVFADLEDGHAWQYDPDLEEFVAANATQRRNLALLAGRPDDPSRS